MGPTDDVTIEDVSVAGADEARLVDQPVGSINIATVVAVVGDVTYEVEVTDLARGRAGALAADLAAASIGRS